VLKRSSTTSLICLENDKIKQYTFLFNAGQNTTTTTTQKQPPFHGHHTVNLHQPAPPVKNWRILLVQSFDCPHALADSNQRRSKYKQSITHTHTHTCLTALCPGRPGRAGTRKVNPIWILLKQQTVSGSGISWAICKSAPRSRQITMPAPHQSVFYRPDALPAAQPTASKH